MRVVGVLDLVGGQAVLARAGQRETYQPVRVVGGRSIAPGDALALADAYLSHFHLSELYAADLDAILGRPAQTALVRRLADCGAPLWLDAGVSSVERAQQAIDLGASRVIVGLETLPSLEVLGDICNEIGGHRVAFGLDLHNGQPIIARQASAGRLGRGEPPHILAALARDAGVGAVVVIDLARIGTSQGLDLPLVRRVRETTTGLTLVAGGGVRGPEDLTTLSGAGCDGALVATALHDGRLCASNVAPLGLITPGPPG